MGYSKRSIFYICGIFTCLIAVFLLNSTNLYITKIISPLGDALRPLTHEKRSYEVFGFAPHWTLHKLDNVDFSTLTTIAYFGIPIDEEGNLVKDDPGYQKFLGERATEIFKKSHAYGTRVVLTLTMMENEAIEAFLDNKEAQNRAIKQAVELVEQRGIDGINVDIEYVGDPGQKYRSEFSDFVGRITNEMHTKNPISKVTVSVYAASAKYPKLYDVSELSNKSDGLFMMAYDFATTGSDIAIPTAPLNGHREGKYWYDISSAVDDFLTKMPADKLILGVPYYGYNYVVGNPSIKAETEPYYSWKGEAMAQTYSVIKNEIKPGMEGVSKYRTGWDSLGKVNWKAYYMPDLETWRMIFFEDEKSLSYKYDFAKNKGLKGVGMWALGFDDGKEELWNLLSKKFGDKLADKRGYE